VHNTILPALTVAAMVCSSLAATPATPKKKRHATATTATTHKRKRPAVTSKTSPAEGSKTTGSKATTVAARRKGKKTRGSARSYQQAPSLDRYREIQQALASKGYFQGGVNGEWGADSVDALKRFQASQNLTSDGKINSLSLIALGLGPRHLTASSNPTPHQPNATAPPATAPAPTAPPQ
jgi:murein L,D-transpeptidase YcbB/YkuD